jgi:hypothetical protein
MKRILIATTAILGFAGVAAAQEAPALSGNYSANVSQRHNEDAAMASGAMAAGGMIDYSATASIDNGSAGGWSNQSDRDYQIYTGK